MDVEKKTLKPDLSAEKEKVESDESSKSEVVEEHTPVTLKVGNAVYNSTKEILLSRDDNSFFHIQFSGRWSLKCDAEKELKVEIKERCGETFADVLHYLRFGDIPRDPMTRAPFLDESSLAKLKAEAEFYLLSNLVKLCESGPLPLFLVTMIGFYNTEVYPCVSYEDARKRYNDYVKWDEIKKVGWKEIKKASPIFSGRHYRCRFLDKDIVPVDCNEIRTIDEKTGLEELQFKRVEILTDGRDTYPSASEPTRCILKIVHTETH